MPNPACRKRNNLPCRFPNKKRHGYCVNPMGIAADYPYLPEQSGKRIGPFTEYARAARVTRLSA
ncbi:hypothetical protein BC2230_11353 [Burkholderia cepacia]